MKQQTSQEGMFLSLIHDHLYLLQLDNLQAGVWSTKNVLATWNNFMLPLETWRRHSLKSLPFRTFPPPVSLQQAELLRTARFFPGALAACDLNVRFLVSHFSVVINGKYCCPKIYFNHRCFSGPYLNKGRIAELPQSVGPGNCVLVLKEVSWVGALQKAVCLKHQGISNYRCNNCNNLEN